MVENINKIPERFTMHCITLDDLVEFLLSWNSGSFHPAVTRCTRDERGSPLIEFAKGKHFDAQIFTCGTNTACAIYLNNEENEITCKVYYVLNNQKLKDLMVEIDDAQIKDITAEQFLILLSAKTDTELLKGESSNDS